MGSTTAPVLPLLAFALTVSSPGASSIRWKAPASCPEHSTVRNRVLRLTGRSEVPTSITADAVVYGSDGTLTLTIDLRTPSGRTHKTLDATDCELLANVAALMMAVAIDPVQTANDPSPRDGTNPPTSPVPTPPPARVDAPPVPASVPASSPSEPQGSTSPVRTPRRVTGVLGASLALGRGVVPAFDARAGLTAGLEAAWLRAELVVFHVVTQTVRYEELPTVGARVGAWGASARLGPRWRRGAFAAHVLATAGVAALVANGFGVSEPGRAVDAWASAGLVPGVRWRPSARLALGLDVEGQLALRRPAFVLDSLAPIHRAARLTILGAVVLEIHLGRRIR